MLITPSVLPPTSLDGRKLTCLLNSAAGNIRSALVESSAETPIPILLARRSSPSKNKRLGGLQRCEKERVLRQFNNAVGVHRKSQSNSLMLLSVWATVLTTVPLIRSQMGASSSETAVSSSSLSSSLHCSSSRTTTVDCWFPTTIIDNYPRRRRSRPPSTSSLVGRWSSGPLVLWSRRCLLVGDCRLLLVVQVTIRHRRQRCLRRHPVADIIVVVVVEVRDGDWRILSRRSSTVVSSLSSRSTSMLARSSSGRSDPESGTPHSDASS